jgi:glycosyltransferase involved in cell wall biosynthesis
VGGAETLMRRLAVRLRAEGEDVEVLTTRARDHFSWADELPAGTRVERGVPVHRYPVDPRRDARRHWHLHSRAAAVEHLGAVEQAEWAAHSVWSPQLQDALEDERRYDWVVAAPYLFGTTLWAVTGRPERTALIPCVHDEPHAWLPLVRRALEAARGAMLNSVGEGELLRRLAPGLPMALVGVGFDPEPAPAPEAVAAFCAARGLAPGYLLYAGRRERAKGLPLLYDGYRLLRRARAHTPPLALMGSGEADPPPDLADHVVDLGYVPDAELGAAYAGASLLANPSRLESLGMVVLESWRMGTPALVNGASPVLRDHVERSGGGLWFRDAPELAEAAGLILDDPGLGERMAAAGSEYVYATFSWPEVCRRFRDALEAWS